MHSLFIHMAKIYVSYTNCIHISCISSNRFHDTSCHTYVALFPVDILCSTLCQELSSANKGHEENALKRDLAIHGLAKMVGQKDKEVLGRSVCSVKLRMFSSQNYWKFVGECVG